MRHAGEVGDDGFAVDILPEGEGQAAFAGVEGGIFQKLPQRHGDLILVGNFDADRVLARDGCEDIDPLGAGGPGQVRLQSGNTVYAQAFARVNLVTRDGRTPGDIPWRHGDAKGGQGADDVILGGPQVGDIGWGRGSGFIPVQQGEGRQLIVGEIAHGQSIGGAIDRFHLVLLLFFPLGK